MQLFELFERKIDAIKQVGLHALAAARRDGVPAHYMDTSLGAGIVRELPDGTRQRTERRNGEIVVTETFGPRR